MDRLEQLRGYTVDELVGEIQRRKDELNGALARIGGNSSGEGRSPKRSAAKQRYWSEWHTYHAAHPDASVQDWQRSKKRRK